MATLVLEHVKVSDLPNSWQEQLRAPASASVTVRIEEEATGAPFAGSDKGIAFGLWRDRDDLGDVEAYVRSLRADRYDRGEPTK